MLCTRNGTVRTRDGQVVTIDNGTIGAVIAIDHNRGSLTVRTIGRSRDVDIDASYLRQGHLRHGYATTIHKAQGATCDHVHVVGPAGLYREAAYVAMSRARHGAFLYATTSQAAQLDNQSHATGIPLPTEQDHDDGELLVRLRQSRAKTLVTVEFLDAAPVASLANQTLSVLEKRLRLVHAVEHQARLDGHTDPAAARLAHTQSAHARSCLQIGARVRALDWDNLGTVQTIDDRTGTATVRFIADHGTATRSRPWHQLHPIDDDPAVLTPAATDWLQRSADAVSALERAWSDQLARSRIHPTEAPGLLAAIALRERRLAAALAGQSPPWLTQLLGARPEDPAGATTYDDALARIAIWRDRQHIPDAVPGLGLPPADPVDADRWHHETEAILHTRCWLNDRPAHAPGTALPAMTGEEIDQRIRHLERILRSAPPDTSRIIAALTTVSDQNDRQQQALTVSLAQQDERRSWILQNWPYVVERHELERLQADHHALAPALPQPVEDLLQRLVDLIEPGDREDRTLAELHDLLQESQPERHLTDLTARLFHIGDRLTLIGEPHANPATGKTTEALLADQRALIHQRDRLRAELADERQRIAMTQALGTDLGSTTVAAIARREHTLATHVLTQPPAWLNRWLTQLHEDGLLSQLPDSTLASAIGRLACYRDRWQIDIDEPCGHQPSAGTLQHQEWQQLTQMIHGPTAAPAPASPTLGH